MTTVCCTTRVSASFVRFPCVTLDLILFLRSDHLRLQARLTGRLVESLREGNAQPSLSNLSSTLETWEKFDGETNEGDKPNFPANQIARGINI